MAENENVGGSGIGMNIEVVLTPRVDEEKLQGQIGQQLEDTTDKTIKNLLNNSKEVEQAMRSVKRLVDGLSGVKRSIRRDPVFKELSSRIDTLTSRYGELTGAGVSTSDVPKLSADFSHLLSNTVTLLQRGLPALTKKSTGKLGEAANLEQLVKTLETRISRYNQSVVTYATAQGMGYEAADPRLIGQRTSVDGYAKKVLVDAQRAIRRGETKASKYEGLNMKGLPKTTGMTVDTEWANFNKDIWSVAYRTERDGLVNIQRNLERDKVTLSKFHESFAKGLTANAGKTVEETVSAFHDAYAGSGRTGLGSMQLPRIVGHNLDVDLEAIRQAADQVIGRNKPSTDVNSAYFKAQQVSKAMTRLLPGGDQRIVATSGDTMKQWAKFLRDDMGFSTHGMPGTGDKTMGNTLSSIAAALGVKYEAHNPLEDVRFTDELSRALSTPRGRGMLKNQFNFEAWSAQAEKDRRAQQFRDQVTKTYGQDYSHLANKYLAGKAINPKELSGAQSNMAMMDLYNNVRESVAVETQGYMSRIANQVSSKTLINDPKSVISQLTEKQNAALEAMKGQVRLGMDALQGKSFTGKSMDAATQEVMQQRNIADSIDRLLSSYGVSDQGQREAAKRAIQERVGMAYATAGLDTAKFSKGAAIDERAVKAIGGDPRDLEAYSVEDRLADASRTTKSNLPSATLMSSWMNDIVGEQLGAIQEATTTASKKAASQIKTKYKTLSAKDLRASDIAATALPVDHPSYRSEASVLAQAKGSVKVKDTIAPAAAKLGDLFEEKAVKYLRDNYADQFKLTATTLDKKGQTTLKYGDLSKQAGGAVFQGHPDAFGLDLLAKKGAQQRLVEFKYRGPENQQYLEAGKIPPNWKAQTAFYSLAAGVPDMPVTYVTGDLEATSPEIRALEKQAASKGITAKTRGALEEQIRQKKAAMAEEDYEIGNLTMTTVAPDKDMQSRVRQFVEKATGVSPEAKGLDAEIRAFLGGGKLTPRVETINKAIQKFAAEMGEGTLSIRQLKNSTAVLEKAEKKAAGELNQLEINEASSKDKKKPQTASDGGGAMDLIDEGGGGGPLPPKWNPNVLPSFTEQLITAEKQLKASRGKIASMQVEVGAKEEYIRRKGAGGVYEVPVAAQYKTDIEGLNTDIANEIRRAQGLTAEVEKLQFLSALSPEAGPDYTSKAAIGTAAQTIKAADLQTAQKRAFEAAAQLEAYGTMPVGLKKALTAASTLEELGAPRTAGLSTKQLLNKALKTGVTVPGIQLSDITSAMDSSAALAGIKPGTTGLQKLKMEANSAVKAVDALFGQLSQHTGKNFLSKESQSVQDFIKKSQEAQEKATGFRATAEIARSAEQAAIAKGAAPLAGQYAKDAAELERRAAALDKEAIAFAEQAKAGATTLSTRRISSTTYRDQFIADQDAQLLQLADKKAQLLGKMQVPGYSLSRGDRDMLDLIRRQETALAGKQPLEGQKFDLKSELQLSTAEAKAQLDKFRLEAQQRSVQLKAQVGLEGLNTENLRAIVSNNLDLAKQGLQSPGMTTFDALNKALNEGVSVAGVETKSPAAFLPSLKPAQGIDQTKATPFDDLINKNKAAEQAVRSLYSALDQQMPDDYGLSGFNKQLYDTEQSVRKSIDGVADLSAAQKAMQAEADAEADPAAKAQKQAQADELAIRRNREQLAVRAEIAGLEKQIAAQRVNPTSNKAIQARTTQFKNQLAVEREQLEIERQMLTIKMKTAGGVHATPQDMLRAQELNSTLLRRFSVGSGGRTGAATDAEIEQLAKSKGINLSQMAQASGGGTYKRSGKDFIGGAIDLLDWQLQWMAGVTVLNTFSAAVKNSIGFAISYEAQLKNIQLITQANTSEMEALTGKVSQLATTFQYSASELGEGLVILGQAGFSATESLAILPSVAALAVATMSNLKVAMDITTTAIEAYNVPVEKAEELTNALAAMTIESKLDIDKLGTSFNYIASTAAAAGFSIEETGTAMGLMSNAGVRASTIGTSLRSVIGSLMNPTAKFETALAKVGLTAEDVSPTTHTLGEIFKKLRAAGFDVEAAFEGLDKRIAGGTITLVQAADEFDSFQAKITGTNRAIAMAEGQMDTFHAQTKRLHNTLQLLGGSWFENDLEPLKDTVKWVNRLTGAALETSKNMPEMAQSMRTAFNSTLALTSILSIGGGVIGGLWNVGKDIRSGLKDEKTALQKQWKEAKTVEAKRSLVQQMRGARTGSTLTGRNKAVYTTATTLFDPGMIVTALALTAGFMALGKAADYASGKTKLVASQEVQDKMASELTTIKEAAQTYRQAAKGTLEFVKARETLMGLGVTDLSDEGIDQTIAFRNAQLRVQAETVQSNKIAFRQSRQTQLMRATMSAEEQKQFDSGFADELIAIAKAEGMFYSAPTADIIELFKRRGLVEGPENTWDPGVYEAINKITSARYEPNAGVAAQQELLSRFMAQANVIADYENTMAGFNARFDRDNPRELPRRTRGLPTRMKNRDAELDIKRGSEAYDYEKQYYEATESIDTLAKQVDIEGYDAMAGSQLAAEDALLEVYNKIKEIRERTEMYKETVGPGLALDKILVGQKRELEIAEDNLAKASRRYVMRTGIDGMAPAWVSMADKFIEYLTVADEEARGGLRLDKGNVEMFKNLDITAMYDIGKKLEANRDALEKELANLPAIVKDGGNMEAVETAIRLKYTIQAEDIIQGELDAVYKPLQTVFSNIEKMIDSRTKTMTSGLRSAQGLYEQLIDIDYSEKGIAAADSMSVFGTTQTTPYALLQKQFGYSSDAKAQDKINAEMDKLRLKQEYDAKVYEQSRTAAEEKYVYAQAGFEDRKFATVAKAREAMLKLELDYHTEVLDLSRSRRDQMEADLKSVASVREQLADRLTKISEGRYSSNKEFYELIQSANQRLYPDNSGPTSAQSLIRSAFKSYRQSKDYVAAGEFGKADTARSEVTRILSGIINDPNRSKEDVARAKRAADNFRVGLNFEYDRAAAGTKSALAQTETYLAEISAVLKAGLNIKPGEYEVDKTTGELKEVAKTPEDTVAKTGTFTANGVTKEVDASAPKPAFKKAADEAVTDVASNEEKVKTIQQAMQAAEEENADRLEKAMVTLKAAAGEMVNIFVDGIAGRLPEIAKAITKATRVEAAKERAEEVIAKRQDAADRTAESLDPTKAIKEEPKKLDGTIRLSLTMDNFGKVYIDKAVKEGLDNLVVIPLKSTLDS